MDFSFFPVNALFIEIANLSLTKKIKIMANLQILAKANLFNAGKGFCIVQFPDCEGGFYIAALATTKTKLEPLISKEEKILWSGTPKQFAEECPVFTERFFGNTRTVSFFGVSD